MSLIIDPKAPSLPHLIFRSFGIKNGLYSVKGRDEQVYVLPKADIYLDCRSLREPNGIPGATIAAQELILKDKDSQWQTSAFQVQVRHTVDHFIPLRRSSEVDPYSRPIEVLCFCAHGLNRSVATKNILGKSNWPANWKVEVK